MGTSQSTPTDQTVPNEPNQGFVSHLFYYPPLSMPTDHPPNRSVQGYLQDPFDYPPLNTPTYQTPNGPNQGFMRDLFYYPPPSTSTDQTPNGPNQDFVQDFFSDLSLNTPTDQTPNGPVQGYLQDPFDNYPPLRTPTNQTSEPNRKCHSCGRLKPATNLGDGRYLCQDCFSISLVQPSQLEHLIHQLHSFFHDYFELPVKKNIPIFLVDANGMGEHAPSPYTQGLTLFNDKATIKIVKRCVRRGAVLEVETEKKKAKRDKVVAILLLFGFPKPIIGATLAHEMGHALIRQQGWTFILERKVEEGICEAIAYEWLKYTVPNCDPSYTRREAAIASYNQKGAEIARRVRIEEMSRIERGEHAAEFREAHRAIKKYGLKRTLKHVGRSRSIPE